MTRGFGKICGKSKHDEIFGGLGDVPAAALLQHQHILDRLNSEIQARSDIIHLQIAKLKAQFTPTETDNTKNITSPTMKKGSQTPSFLDTGCIRVSPPQLRNRTNDIKLITEMSEAMHEQRSPRRGYNDQKLKL